MTTADVLPKPPPPSQRPGRACFVILIAALIIGLVVGVFIFWIFSFGFSF